MLLVGDIHINARYKDRIIDELRKYINDNADEKNIIFLGDYVYHFSYDRQSLLELYDFFVELYMQGKNVYVLAGNHDWLGSSFVFEEARKAFDIIGKLDLTNSKWQLKFFTSPEVINIEGEVVLFFPYMLEQPKDDLDIELWTDELSTQIKTLLESKHKQEYHSGWVNKLLYQYVNKYDKLTVLHHYYIEGTTFPGQKSKFYYKNIALSNKFLDNSKIKMISGHLHQNFVFKNYVCLWSVWNTHSLEINELKWLWKYSSEQDKLLMKQIVINPYIWIDNTEVKMEWLFGNEWETETHYKKIDAELLNEKYKEIIEENKQNMLDKSVWNVEFDLKEKLSLSDVNLSVKVWEIDYTKIENYVDKEVLEQLKDIKLKKQTANMKDLLKDFDVSTKNLTTGFADWKTILKEYLKKKYGEEYSIYEKMMDELKLL